MVRHYVKPCLESLFEVMFTLVFSFVFIFIATLAYGLSHDGVDIGTAISYVLEKNVKPTETFGYILGFLAPAMWIMFRYFDRWKHAWLLRALFVSQGIAALAATVIFILSFLQLINNKELADLWSWICVAIALLVWYLTLVYQKAVLEGAADQIQQPTPESQSGTDVLASLRGHK